MSVKEKLILWLIVFGAVVLSTFLVTRQYDAGKAAELAIRVQLDSLAEAHRVQRSLDSVAVKNGLIIDSLTRQDAARDIKISAANHVSDSLRKALQRQPAPAIADSTNPRWMHRSLAQDTIIKNDSSVMAEQLFDHASDRAQIVIYRGTIMTDSAQIKRLFRISDSLATINVTNPNSLNCSFSHPSNCISKRQAALLGVLFGAEITARLAGRNLIP